MVSLLLVKEFLSLCLQFFHEIRHYDHGMQLLLAKVQDKLKELDPGRADVLNLVDQIRVGHTMLFCIFTLFHNSLSYFYLPPADRPGTGDYKMPDVRPCVRPSVRPFVTFYKRLHNSFVYEHKFTKLTQKVYVNKGMSLLTFGLILKNKMAARAIFQFFFFIFQNPLTLAVL